MLEYINTHPSPDDSNVEERQEEERKLLITYGRHLRMKLGLFGLYNLKDTTDWADEFLKDNHKNT